MCGPVSCWWIKRKKKWSVSLCRFGCLQLCLFKASRAQFCSVPFCLIHWRSSLLHLGEKLTADLSASAVAAGEGMWWETDLPSKGAFRLTRPRLHSLRKHLCCKFSIRSGHVKNKLTDAKRKLSTKRLAVKWNCLLSKTWKQDLKKKKKTFYSTHSDDPRTQHNHLAVVSLLLRLGASRGVWNWKHFKLLKTSRPILFESSANETFILTQILQRVGLLLFLGHPLIHTSGH